MGTVRARGDDIAGRAGTIATLNERFVKAMKAPETVQRLERDGIDVIGSTPEQAASTLESELKRFAVLIRERKMKAN